MANPWQKSWNDHKKLLDAGGGWACMAHIFWFVGIIFLLLGIIGDATNMTLGLEPTSWLLLGIAAILSGIPAFIGWHSVVHMDAMQTKGKKKE